MSADTIDCELRTVVKPGFVRCALRMSEMS
jgi:hypothetical protein